MDEKILEIVYEGNDMVVRIHGQAIPKVPAAVRRHARAASREALLALRNVIDAAVKYTEDKDHKDSQPRTNVEIE